MGGYGSGRWGWGKSDEKTLVEDCRSLDIVPLIRDGTIRPDRFYRGTMRWTRNGEEVASIGFEVATEEDRGTFRLLYSVGREEKTPMNYVVPLATSRLVSGGRRWWFRCSAGRTGGPTCGRRVGKLYLPPSGKVFACRHCYDLAYTSSRESRKYDSMFRMLAADTHLPVDVVKRVMNRDRRRRSGT
jgi:hypothetical protein